MKKLLVGFLILCFFFFTPEAEGVRKTRKRHSPKHALIVENIDRFQGFIGEFLYEQTAAKSNPDDRDSLVVEHLRNTRVIVEVVSNFQLNQKDVNDCLPVLTLRNNGGSESDHTIVWDIRPIEKKTMRSIAAKKALDAKKQLSKNDKNLFEKHPYYCAGIGMLSTGICCGVSGWLLHARYVK